MHLNEGVLGLLSTQDSIVNSLSRFSLMQATLLSIEGETVEASQYLTKESFTKLTLRQVYKQALCQTLEPLAQQVLKSYQLRRSE